jgi:hypothetical protein
VFVVRETTWELESRDLKDLVICWGKKHRHLHVHQGAHPTSDLGLHGEIQKLSESSSTGLSSDALLLNRATNAWVMGVFANDVPVLSTLVRVVQTMGSNVDALLSGMVKTSWGF